MNHADADRLRLPVNAADPTTAGSRELPAKTSNTWPIFLASVWKLARQKYYWSPSRFFRIVWNMARSIPTQIRVNRVLARPVYRQLAKVNPRFPFKYSGLNYLARGLTINQQAECFLHHYRRLPNLLPEEVLAQILLEDLLLDEIREGDDCFTVRMGLSRPYDDAGELSLNFGVNGKVVFILSFTIVPGWIVQSEAQEVFLVSRLQGVKGCYDEIQRATKTLYHLAPPALLFAALCGVAEAFEIKAMAGITGTMRPEFYFNEEGAVHIQQAYDGFFRELGATKGRANFYLGPMPALEKHVASIEQGHKKGRKGVRTRKKRATKLDIARRIYLFLSEAIERGSTGKVEQPCSIGKEP
jgi:uncharacterized protein VirK/YbjX